MKTLRYTKITKKRLDEVLGLVHWTTRHYGADHYRLVNPYGAVSNFMFVWHRDDPNVPIYDIRIDEFGEQRPFGASPKEISYCHNGIFGFNLKDCVLEANSLHKDSDKYDYVTIYPKLAKNNFLSFSAPFKPELINSLKE